MRSDQQIARAMELYADMVVRICLIHLKSEADTQDIFQEVFLKYALSSVEFESQEHEKAWFIRVSINACKDLLRSFFKRSVVSLESAMEPYGKEIGPEQSEVLQAVLSLPKKYKDAIYLHYYEGYPATEIAKILRKNTNTIYTWLSRGRELLRRELGGEGDENESA